MARDSKFNVSKDKSKRTYDDIVFDSEMEMRYYRDVVLPQWRSGEIKHYELQKKYILQPEFKHDGKRIQPIIYVADFYIEYSNGKSVVIDTKGFADSCAKMKRKLFWYTYPNIEYYWLCYSKMDGGWCNFDDVNRRRREARKIKKLQQKQENEKEI